MKKRKIRRAFILGYNAKSFITEDDYLQKAYEAGKNASEENRILGLRNPEFYLYEYLRKEKI